MLRTSQLLLLVAVVAAVRGALDLSNEHGLQCSAEYNQVNNDHEHDNDFTCVRIFDNLNLQLNSVSGLQEFTGPMSQTSDDAQSVTVCPAGQILTSCRCAGAACDGARPMIPSANACTAHNRAGGSGVMAHSSCIDAVTPEGQPLEATVVRAQNVQTVSCDDVNGVLVDCQCWSPWTQSGYCTSGATISGNSCTAGSNPAPGNVYWELQALCVREFIPPREECGQFNSEHLETEYEPFLHVPSTGFSPLEKDVFIFSVDVHRKYDNVALTTGGAVGTETLFHSEETSITGQTPTTCWDHYKVSLLWGDLVDRCHLTDEGGPDGYLSYTCKLIIDATEDLSPIRSTQLTREMHWELPVTVKFPKQVSATVGDLTAFQPPDLQAAIIRQEVDVNLNSLEVDALVRLYTSVQWPFRLKTNPSDLTINSLAPSILPNPASSPAFYSNTDCADPGFSHLDEGTVDSPCIQTWHLEIVPAGGALTGPCELDGSYSVSFKAECHGDYNSDCPMVPDDQGVLQNEFRVDFILDSENYCPQVVDTVELTADLKVYKDEAHAVSASNFILGQFAYFVLTVASPDVTVQSTTITSLTWTDIRGTHDVIFQGITIPAHGLDSFEVRNSDDAGVPATESWFKFKITAPPFAPPVDGSEDFSVDATADVVFKNADGSLLERSFSLLQAIDGTKTQPIAGGVTMKMAGTTGDKTEGETSGAACGAVAGLLALVSTAAAAC